MPDVFNGLQADVNPDPDIGIASHADYSIALRWHRFHQLMLPVLGYSHANSTNSLLVHELYT